MDEIEQLQLNELESERNQIQRVLDEGAFTGLWGALYRLRLADIDKEIEQLAGMGLVA